MNEKKKTNEGQEVGVSRAGYFAGLITGGVAIALVVVLLTTFAPGLLSRSQNAGTLTRPPAVNVDLGVEAKINEILAVLDQLYIGEIDRELLLEDMFRGLVFGVGDPYTVYFTREEFQAYMQDTDGAFSGIGVSVSVDRNDNMIEIIAPYEGSPGYLAGLLPRDKITAVDGLSVNGDLLQHTIRAIRGVPGTPVTLTILRNGQTFDVEIVRADIEVPTVSHEMLENGIGYIRINQFAQVTDEQFFAALNILQTQGLQRLIIDLRNNPGGRLDTVLRITNALIPEGIIMYTESRADGTTYHYADREYLGMPLIILVNGNSASASEVLAGAVRDTGAGQILGTTTYGKGVVQTIAVLSCESAVKVTTSRYYTPNGISIQDVGIEPHFRVEMDGSISISSLNREEDVQLQAALEIIRTK